MAHNRDRIAKAQCEIVCWNTVVVSVLSAAACTVISALAAYAFVQMAFPGRNVLLDIFIAMIVVPRRVVRLRPARSR